MGPDSRLIRAGRPAGVARELNPVRLDTLQPPPPGEARRQVAPLVRALASIYGLRDGAGQGAVPLHALLDAACAGRASVPPGGPALLLNSMAATTLASALHGLLGTRDRTAAALRSQLGTDWLALELDTGSRVRVRAARAARHELRALDGRRTMTRTGLRIELPLASMIAGLQPH